MKKSGSVEWLTAYDKRTESRCAADSARGGGGVGRGRKLDRALKQTVARPAKYSAHLRGPLDFAEACRVACSRRSSGFRVRVLEIAASHSGDVPSQKSTCSQANLKKISQSRRPLNKSTAIAIMRAPVAQAHVSEGATTAAQLRGPMTHTCRCKDFVESLQYWHDRDYQPRGGLLRHSRR